MSKIAKALAKAKKGNEVLVEMIREYLLVCDRMSDHILLIYAEMQSLPAQWRKRLLENEVRITGLFVEVLARLISAGKLSRLDDRTIELLAHNISVLGHMWTFRRWFLARYYNIEDYIELQTKFILGIFNRK